MRILNHLKTRRLKMGLRNKIAAMQGNASQSMQEETAKLNKQLADFESAVVDRLNWSMKLLQKIADELKIEVDDRLEE